MAEMLTIHCYVSGRVHGVWFRASTQEKAKELGLTGWVRNLPDGRVETIASGEKTQLMPFFEWLKQGPPMAKVTDVTYEELPFKEYERFGLM